MDEINQIVCSFQGHSAVFFLVSMIKKVKTVTLYVFSCLLFVALYVCFFISQKLFSLSVALLFDKFEINIPKIPVILLRMRKS